MICNLRFVDAVEHVDDVTGQGVPAHLGVEGADSAGQACQAAHRGELRAHARGERRARQGAPNTGTPQARQGAANTDKPCLLGWVLVLQQVSERLCEAHY